MYWDSKAKGGIVDIYKDYNAVEKWALLHTWDLQFILTSYTFVESKKRQRKKKLSKKSIIDSEEQVLKINAKGSEHLNDILEARAIGKEHLDDYLNERFFEEKISFWDSVKKLNLKTSSIGDKPIVCKEKHQNDNSEGRRKPILLID